MTYLPHAELFRVGNFVIYTHGFFAVLGITFGSASIYFLARKRLDCTQLFDTIVYTILSGIIGARVAYYILYSDQFNSWTEIFRLWEGGLVSYGGFIAGIIMLYVCFRKQRRHLPEWFDIFSLGFLGGMFLGRIGEIVAGENFGVISASRISINGYIPISLFEGLWCLVLFIVLTRLYLRSRLQHKKGMTFVLMVLFYSSGRFVIDYWREGKELVAGITLSQIASLATFVLMFIVIIILTLAKRKRGNHAPLETTS